MAASPASAQVFDDRGISGGGRPDSVEAIEGEALPGRRAAFRARRVATTAVEEEDRLSGALQLEDDAGGVSGLAAATVYLWDGHRITAWTQTDASGRWSLAKPAGSYAIWARLETPHWGIQDAQGGRYEWEIGTGAYLLAKDNPSTKIARIHMQYVGAVEKLKALGIGLGWWSSRLRVVYPATGNFFTSHDFTVHLTRAEAWDVNLHELGHAIMAAGTRSYGGGGEHRMSQCYNQGLAWSEGWATFLAAAVSFSPGAEDPRFQYLAGGVPIENVPDSTCRGDTNEWRVAAALWDFMDTHKDGADDFSTGFKRIWNSIQGQSMGSFPDAWAFVRAGLKAEERAGAQGVLEQNTLAAPAALAQRPANLAGAQTLAQSLAAPAFEGALR